jgi:hypothetical protein
MSDAPKQGLTPMAKIVLMLVVVLLIVGAVLHGLSFATLQRLWTDLVERPGGPMTFRFILQPTMAVIAALHDGIMDARLGRSPYLWTIMTNREARGGLLAEGLGATARIILLGLGMDLVYQVTVFGTFYPGEAVDIAILLAFVPYLLLRGPISRIARNRVARKSQDGAA